MSTATETTVTNGPVCLDDFLSVLAEYDPTSRWNGWLAAPRLDAHGVQFVLTLLSADESTDPADRITWDWREDGALVMRDGQEDEPVVELPNTDGLYALGAFGWVWSEDEDPTTSQHYPADVIVKATYHDIVRAKCLTCAHEVRATDEGGVTTLELWNDYGVDCIANDCEGASEWELADGTVSVVTTDVADLSVGDHVEGTTEHGPFSGTFDGVRPSEWDGKPTAYFTDGVLGTTPQGIFGFPVDKPVHQMTARKVSTDA